MEIANIRISKITPKPCGRSDFINQLIGLRCIENGRTFLAAFSWNKASKVWIREPALDAINYFEKKGW